MKSALSFFVITDGFRFADVIILNYVVKVTYPDSQQNCLWFDTKLGYIELKIDDLSCTQNRSNTSVAKYM